MRKPSRVTIGGVTDTFRGHVAHPKSVVSLECARWRYKRGWPTHDDSILTVPPFTNGVKKRQLPVNFSTDEWAMLLRLCNSPNPTRQEQTIYYKIRRILYIIGRSNGHYTVHSFVPA